jgi:general secretion pathway protein I
MTLLEVILAIAILGGALAMLGELIRVGTRSARAARVMSTAQLLADSLVSEIAAGISQPQATEGTVDNFGGFAWSYIVQVEHVDQQGLLAVAVTVRENLDQSQQPTSYTLVRWMVDPQVEYELETAAAEAAAASSSSTQSSANGTSGTSGTTGTGTSTGGTQ